MPPPLLARTEMYTVRLDQQSVYLRIIDNLHLLIICLNTELCTHRKERYTHIIANVFKALYISFQYIKIIFFLNFKVVVP